jgi:lysophospholipase
MDCGVVPGFDMTPEAALTKLSYVLSKNAWNLETKIDVILDFLEILLNFCHSHP